jgi:RNase P protein component
MAPQTAEELVADYEATLASLSPKQAWACGVAISIQAVLRHRVSRLSAEACRRIATTEGVEAHMDVVRREITTEILRRDRWVERIDPTLRSLAPPP